MLVYWGLPRKRKFKLEHTIQILIWYYTVVNVSYIEIFIHLTLNPSLKYKMKLFQPGLTSIHSVQHNHWHRCKLIQQKTAMGQAEQGPDLTRLASNILGRIQSHLCLTEWRAKWKLAIQISGVRISTFKTA